VRCGARDITERKRAAARQAVLIRELQHRTKNLLAVIQSIVANTRAHSGFGSKLIAVASIDPPRISYATYGLEYSVGVPLCQVMKHAPLAD
jgi:hypothetical protein